jgi:type IV pilus assembly protein PilB
MYEVMTMTDPIKELVLQGVSATELKAEAMRRGMRTLRMSGITKICQGTSSVEEVARVTAAD